MDKFSGQWIGDFNGSNSGLAVLDLDGCKDWLEGSFYAFDQSNKVPSTLGSVVVTPKDKRLEIETKAFALHPSIPRFSTVEELKGVDFPSSVEVKLDLSGDELSGTWSTNIETNGTVLLHRSRAKLASEYEADPIANDWASFQQEVLKAAQEPYRYIFRGQSESWRLRTSFHRTQRTDLNRYWDEDFPRIRHASVGQLDHFFEPGNPDHNGAFMHLLQHHGYPTPMLDWSYSPYIAAYFAFSSSIQSPDSQEPVRIFMFDAEEWRNDFNQLLNIVHCRPHFSLVEPFAIGNPRALPQQSIASITNVDDIESYIRFQETANKKTYLRVFDLPKNDRFHALKQLGLMGISPGSMFPGIDGLCREYRDRSFGYDR